MHDKIKRILSLAFILTAMTINAATVVWTGASGTDTNWSNGNNWVGTVTPGGGDDVKFFDAGSNLVLGAPNSLVDGAFTGYIGSLQLGNTNGMHTIVIAAGTSLGITNGNLTEGTPTDPGVIKNFTNTITGAGSTLYISNLTANISINQITALTTAAATPNRGNLNLSGLDNFFVSANRIGIGDGQLPGVPLNNHAGGNLILARTNVITLAYTDTLANYQTAGKSSAIILSRNSGNNPSIVSILQLGVVNTFNVDSMNFGMDKSGNNSTAAHGIMVFNPAFAGQNPTATFNGAGGPGTRVTWWSIGDGNSSGSSSNGGGGTNDFSLGTVNAFVNVMSLGRDAANSADVWAGPHKGVFTFTNGTVDVNTVILGNQSLETGSSTTPSLGVFNVYGSGALLKVNTLMTLGTATLATVAGTGTRGVLNITNGTVYANNIAVGVNSVNNTISLWNGTLVVSNTIATNISGLFSLAATNSTLGLTVPANGSLVGLVQSLAPGGTTNVLQLSVPVYSSYPQTIPLIQYTTLIGTANFGLTNVPASAPGAYLTNLTTIPKSIALVLPTDPRPVFTAQPSSYSGNPGDNVTTNFLVSIAATSVTPLAYQWYYYTNGGTTNLLVNGPGPSGTSTISGTTTTNLQTANAQVLDSGNYFVVASNAYGTAASSSAILTISSGGIPIINPVPLNQTVIQGNNATFTAGVSANPAATIYWQTGGTNIPGANTSTLVVNNVQYPANDQQVFSIIATNSFGSVTNSATLTVIVPPTITVQPVSQVVTNTQSVSFTVTVVGAVPAEAYQWKKNGVAIPGATSSTFTIASASASDIASNYTCIITNLAGTTNTASVSLIVNSTMSPVTLSPANAQTGVCYDTPLYITFDKVPLTRNAGTIKIYNATNPATPVDTLDMSQNSVITQIGTGIAPYPVNVQPRTIAGASYVTFPVIITSNTAAIYPHEGVMTSNQTYYVTIDNGVFTDTNGAYFAGITANNIWQFTTKPVGPTPGTNYVVVSTDGTADFCTIQGAVDFFPNFTNTTSFNRVIYLRKGNSVEIARIPVGKNNITLRGEDRQQSLLSYPNSNLINPSSHTVMVLHVLANDIAIENLTLTNSVPQGGSQSFALMVETGAKRFICNNANVDSYQDTILVNTIDCTAYFYRSLIQGDVDFIWGGGNCYFTNCELRELRTGGIYFQPRTPAGSNGIAAVRCQLTRFSGTNASGSNFNNCLFARALGNTNSNVGLIYCNIDTNVVQTGWTASDIADPGLAERWWEYGNSNLDGTAPAVYNGIQLSNSDPRLLPALNATTWLYGWTPQLAPNIIGQPANATVSQGQSTNFKVSATGIPEPTYQWYQNGQIISGATATNYNISSAVRTNAGNYTVVVSNGSGSVTSAVAVVTYAGNVAPVVNPSTYSRPAGYPLNISIAGNLATHWSDADADPLTLTGSISSTNGAMVNYDSTYVYYTNANNVADEIDYTVGDGFGGNTPGSINVLVGPPPTNSVVSTVVNGNGSVTLSLVGVPNYIYRVESTTNLAPPIWIPVSTNTADINGLWQFTDSQATNYLQQFYRSVYRP